MIYLREWGVYTERDSATYMSTRLLPLLKQQAITKYVHYFLPLYKEVLVEFPLYPLHFFS